MSYVFIPELQYWFNQFVISAEDDKFNAPHPVDVPTEILSISSFIEMLFNESYDSDEYFYYFAKVERVSSWNRFVRDRLMVYPGISSYYQACESDQTGAVNLFLLESDDIELLDKLLEYRVDSTTSIDDIVFDDLETNLSKLIYIYLDLKLNENISNYDNLSIIASSSSILENCYEFFVIEKIFEFLDDQNI